MSAMVKSTPASWAAASRCSTVLVEPPMAMSRLMAFSKASKLAMERGSTRASSSSYQRRASSTTSRPASRNSSLRAAWVASREPFPGRLKPQGLGQAVHGVGREHPGAGAAGRTGGALDRRDVRVAFPGVGGGHHGVHQIELQLAPAPDHLARLHGATGNEDGGDVQPQGRHQHPGVILSQLEMQTRASAQWALTMYSTESAMMSRDGSE